MILDKEKSILSQVSSNILSNGNGIFAMKCFSLILLSISPFSRSFKDELIWYIALEVTVLSFTLNSSKYRRGIILKQERKRCLKDVCDGYFCVIKTKILCALNFGSKL